MREFRRLLVALDLLPGQRTLTAGSTRAAEQALALATHLDAEVELLHATASDEAWDEAEQVYVEVPGEAPAARRPVVEEVAERFRRAGVEARAVATEETAWLSIVRHVIQNRIDLVVAGKRNQRGRRLPPLGSVATKLIRKCPCAVWVAKPDAEPELRRVLAASDLTPVGERVIESAAFVAGRFGAELHVAHAFQRPLAVQMERSADADEFDRSEREARIRRLAEVVARFPEAPEAAYHVGRTSPTRAILDCEKRLEPDLVVMGTVSRGGVAGLLLGNTAERVLSRLEASLLTVKPADFVCPVTAD